MNSRGMIAFAQKVRRGGSSSLQALLCPRASRTKVAGRRFREEQQLQGRRLLLGCAYIMRARAARCFSVASQGAPGRYFLCPPAVQSGTLRSLDRIA
jgi:hypothetical protein